MPDWLGSFRGKGTARRGAPVLEFLVVEGVDTGQRFTMDAPSVAIARGIPKSGQPGAILLSDPTVSAHQASIVSGADGVVLQHQRSATNPTLVNGEVISSRGISPGDRIQMGRVVLEVREREGMALSDLMEAPEAHPASPSPLPGETTEVRPRVEPSYYLALVDGGRRFSLTRPNAVIGRDSSSDICIDVRAVSRRHAEIQWEGDQLILVHHSKVNQTFLNGVPVEGRAPISSGDEIRLADRVALRLGHEDAAASTTQPDSLDDLHQETSLQFRMEEKIARDLEIEAKYAVTGSFLDVDVVGSYGMKSESNRPEHIIVSFERWRSWVRRLVEENGGMVLNSNGDELMCFFDSTLQSVDAARAVLGTLDAFNREENVLASPFRLRVGIHTGSSLVDRKRGVAYSAVLDVAGHLQKDADVNGLLISEDTLQALPDRTHFVPAGRLERENIATYRFDPID